MTATLQFSVELFVMLPPRYSYVMRPPPRHFIHPCRRYRSLRAWCVYYTYTTYTTLTSRARFCRVYFKRAVAWLRLMFYVLVAFASVGYQAPPPPLFQNEIASWVSQSQSHFNIDRNEYETREDSFYVCSWQTSYQMQC